MSTTDAIARARGLEYEFSIADGAEFLARVCASIQEEAQGKVFKELPPEVQERCRRFARQAIGRMDPVREELARHTATRAVQNVLASATNVSTPDTARAVVWAALEAYFAVCELRPHTV